MKHFLLIISFIFLSFNIFSQQKLTQQDLVQESKIANLMLPYMIDDETRLDSTTVPDYHTFQYNFTLVNIPLIDINIDDFTKVMTDRIVKTINSPPFAIVKENNITLNFLYYDRNKILIVIISITPDKYKTNKI